MSGLQQPTEFEPGHDCTPESATIAAMMDQPSLAAAELKCSSAGTEVQGVIGMWWVYFRRGDELVGAAIIEAPTLYQRAPGSLFAELADRQILAKSRRSTPNMRR